MTKLPESKKKKRLTNWLNTLLENYQNRIHSIDIIVAENWGVMQGKAVKVLIYTPWGVTENSPGPLKIPVYLG